jgi:hypothetical protein
MGKVPANDARDEALLYKGHHPYKIKNNPIIYPIARRTQSKELEKSFALAYWEPKGHT